MTAGSPDRVDCVHLAAERATLERVYRCGELPRLQGLLAATGGQVRMSVAFAETGAGRSGATVTLNATPELVCQRCLRGFEFAVAAHSDVEFVDDDAPQMPDSEREAFAMNQGSISLRELAEEELLLALPLAPACSAPGRCGRAPAIEAGDDARAASETRRPFGDLRNLLKKT